MSEIVQSIEAYGIRAQGKKEFIKHLNGEKTARFEAIKAKCYDCMGFYADGVQDCGVKDCPLYPFHPYKSL